MTRWQRHLAALGLLWAIILALFWRDAADMAGIWWHSSTFTHCLLMVPMIGWLVSQRAALLRPLTPVFWWPALIWIAGAGLVWLVGEAAWVGLFRQLRLVLMLQGARSEEHTSELQALMRTSYAVFCLKKKNNQIEKVQKNT